MKESDLFVRSLKENPPLKASLFAWFDEMRAVFVEEMITQKGDEVVERQGIIKGLKKMKGRLQEITSGQKENSSTL